MKRKRKKEEGGGTTMEVGDGNNICTGPTGDSRWGWLVSRLARRPLATSAPLASEPPHFPLPAPVASCRQRTPACRSCPPRQPTSPPLPSMSGRTHVSRRCCSMTSLPRPFQVPSPFPPRSLSSSPLRSSPPVSTPPS
jgi:hypothetical protein